MGDQTGIEKLAILTKTNWNGTTAEIYWAGILQKETTATMKARKNLLVEVKAKTYYGLKTMARKFLKTWTGGKHYCAPAKCTNVLCQVQKGGKWS